MEPTSPFTGFGEKFVKKVAAYDLHSRMEYGGLPLEKATDSVVSEHLAPGAGGLIAVDNQGNIAIAFNIKGMFRGYKTSAVDFFIKI